ncbi:ribosome biogenesis protein Nop53/GLTSCR2 [Phascolomyces articulosus]|uniref:Ribosome biogenesis protein NOP53 n=1 Tax=Phascolomyces articulosus TaxID=60185 RepID=A0AAD5KCP7_9FUNG|nr:ribosome biogenesis protein Nop53/GLTSCR2 [Phascolomyces articulosus]
MSTAQVEKKLQPSRKGKKAWRKNIDMQPVDEALESLRVEERVRGLGAKIDDLFTIDTTGDLQVKRQLARDKPLKVDEILAERSAVPAVIARVKAANVEKKESKHDLQKVNHIAKRKREGAIPPSAPKKKKKQSVKQASYDMWGDVEEEQEDASKGYLDVVKERKVKAPSTLKSKPAAMVHKASVEVPHAGASYNPTMEDHQELLKEAHAIEVKKEEATKKLNEQLAYRKELDQLKSELEESISDDEDEDEGEEEEEEQGEESAKQKQEGVRKTKTQRNKEKRKRYNRMLEEQKIHERDIRKQIDRVKAIEAELQEQIEKLEKAAEIRRHLKEEDEKKGARRLGRHYIKEQPMAVQLQEELSETLRQLKVRKCFI